ncbi:transposase [Ferruginibacter sp. HRS2-29]|uniref:transposase n=1 Tax=Ferruginibacter sp. HRS2-29 TaxID=2487334 RepID=UPI0034E9858B|nr:hypothetical protein [Ferruginibacter sp. HRS2-29]
MGFKKQKQYRLRGYDYSQNGAYFITIVTKKRVPFFGYIENKQMHLSPIGEFVNRNFLMIQEKIKYLTITEFTIMPDHLHMIILIDKKCSDVFQSEVTSIFCETTSLFPLIKESISSFANHLKGTIKKWCNKNKYSQFEWQEKFHDHIIRNEREYRKIVEYIRNNVKNWP